MKKRYLILAGLLVMTVAAAGCGKKKTTETAPVEVTATPTPEVTKAVDMVDMQQTADEDIKNVMGEKTSTASKIVFVNNTGDDIQSLYIRTHVDEDSEDYDADEDGGWGDDLINGMFTLTDKDKALYYMQTANTQTSGTQTSGTQTSDTQTSGTQTSDTQTSDTQTTSNKSTASYDIRIAYTDEDTNECFFRDIPLGTISQITLCMDGTDDDAIPYAKYLTGTSTKEVSTLDAVKKRLGIIDDSESESDSTDDSDQNSADNSDSADNNNSGDQNTDDNGNGSNNGSDDGNDGSTDDGNGGSTDNENGGNTDQDNSGGDMISTAEQYIGQSLDALEGACGSPQGSSYEDDPETGKTGFHYYSNFTVSTTVDENGNEIVAGIW